MAEIRSGKDKYSLYRRIAVFIGIAVNVLLSFVMHRFGLPLYLDCIGTIAVSAIGGALPGFVTAVFSNVFCSFFNENALYYSVISVLIALITAAFVKYGKLRKAGTIAAYLLSIAAVSGILGICIQWLILKQPQFEAVAEVSKYIFKDSGMSYFLGTMLINLGLNLVDKAISAVIAAVVFICVPVKLRKAIWNSGWKQLPPPERYISDTDRIPRKHSLKWEVILFVAVAAIAFAVVMTSISIKLYSDDLRKEYTDNAYNAARFAAEVVDGDKVEEYLKKGKAAEGYSETEKLLYNIRDNANGVKYLYVLKVENEGCTYIFDLQTGDEEGMLPGEFSPIEEAFKPYLQALLEWDEIVPIESDDISGWVLTVYCPVKDSVGRTVAYAGADISMKYLSEYVIDFIIKTVLIFSGFFALVIGFGLSLSGYYLVFPIRGMTSAVQLFMLSDKTQKEIDASVKKARILDIRTGNEVEELYHAMCKMEADMAEQLREIRHYAEATAKMQNGLIITMADMVENRDSDTGAHIQKTAAYVRIILNGLKAKGYYLEKLNDKYMSDVEMSAPLHDVGKINIPDALLQKKGKLETDEFEIMKTHTTVGKAIIENAISTVEGQNYLKEARNMAAYHHERWDGNGYPEGLHGEVIPLSARVMAVADVFDALTSPRVYKPAFPLEKALQIIEEGKGTQFDPKCVEVFMDSLDEVKKILRKYNNTDT